MPRVTLLHSNILAHNGLIFSGSVLSSIKYYFIDIVFLKWNLERSLSYKDLRKMFCLQILCRDQKNIPLYLSCLPI